jgi:hypothetical protein
MKKPFLFLTLFIIPFLLSGCGSIGGDPIPDLIMMATIPAIIFYCIALLFIGIGFLIKKIALKKFNFETHKLLISFVFSISTFIILNIPLLLTDSDIATIFFYLVTPCSIAIFLGIYNDKFSKNAFYLFVAMIVLILIFAIDTHGPLLIIDIYRMFRIY